MTAVKLTRSETAGIRKLAGTDILIERHQGRWRAVGTSEPAVRWLKDAGVRGLRFARRCELLAVIAAHSASSPPPEQAGPSAPVRLRPDGPGRHVTAEGDYEITRHGPSPAIHWQITPSDAGAVVYAPTLAVACRYIGLRRDSLARARRAA